jgi:SpoIID/LytB domain protein
MPRRLVAAAAVVLALSLCSPAGAAPRSTDRPAMTLGAGPVRLVPLGKEPLSVSQLHSYLGQVLLDPAADGLVLVNELSLERYLLGLDEVPADWPMEALRAQAVAARTYALWTLARPRSGAAATYGFDICASIECQVFSGADVIDAHDGGRWREAVRSTAREAILYSGQPILARYHSTSGGRTLANSEAFEGAADLPYLQPVPSTTEAASPLYRWMVTFTLARLQRALASGGWWDASLGRLVEVRTTASRSGRHYPDVVFRGARTLRRTAEELRSLLRDVAPRLWPDLYPAPAPTSSGRLPETLPSNRVSIATEGRRVVIVGRGWGHGTGMSQWGAHGMARAGAGYEEILEHYYTGVSIGRAPATPALEVGIDWARRSVEVFGSFRVEDAATATVVGRAIGSWRFRPAADGAVAITPPRSHGRPLRLRLLAGPQRVEVGDDAHLAVRVSTAARVSAVSEGTRTAPVTVSPGRARVAWRAPTRPGRYVVRVRAATASDVRSTHPVEIVVLPPESRMDRARAAGDEAVPAIALWAAAAGFLVAVAAGSLSFVGTMGGWSGRSPWRNG